MKTGVTDNPESVVSGGVFTRDRAVVRSLAVDFRVIDVDGGSPLSTRFVPSSGPVGSGVRKFRASVRSSGSDRCAKIERVG